MKYRIAIFVGILALAVGTTFTIHKATASSGPKLKPDLIVDSKKALAELGRAGGGLTCEFL